MPKKHTQQHEKRQWNKINQSVTQEKNAAQL